MAARPGKINSAPAETTKEKTGALTARGPVAREEIQVLLLEDDERDADLIRRALRTAGVPFHMTCVQTKGAFVQQLTQSPPT